MRIRKFPFHTHLSPWLGLAISHVCDVYGVNGNGNLLPFLLFSAIIIIITLSIFFTCDFSCAQVFAFNFPSTLCLRKKESEKRKTYFFSVIYFISILFALVRLCSHPEPTGAEKFDRHSVKSHERSRECVGEYEN